MSQPPVLTDAQREQARALALESRRQRARIRALLAEGQLSAAEVLERSEHESACAKLRVRELLLSLPGIGPARCAEIMSAVGISQTRRVRGLGARQRAELLHLLNPSDAPGASR